jgi:hypothetical protein
MASLGREEFYRRRFLWLRANGKEVSLRRLVAFLEREGIDIGIVHDD